MSVLAALDGWGGAGEDRKWRRRAEEEGGSGCEPGGWVEAREGEDGGQDDEGEEGEPEEEGRRGSGMHAQSGSVELVRRAAGSKVILRSGRGQRGRRWRGRRGCGVVSDASKKLKLAMAPCGTRWVSKAGSRLTSRGMGTWSINDTDDGRLSMTAGTSCVRL